MRVAALLLILVLTLNVSASGWAQTVTISEKNMPVEKVFREIHRQTGYEFVYSVQMLQNTRSIDLNVNNAPVNDVLDICFRGTSLTYAIVDRTIVVKSREKQTVSTSDDVAPVDISGVVTDENGLPLQSVSVLVKGSPIGTTTDANGRFSLKNVEEGSVLVISIVGYKSQEVKISKANPALKIALEGDATRLQDVVVTGYQKIEKKKFTGASSTVKMDDIKIAGVTDVTRMLEGRVAGVSIQNVSGTFGAAPKIRIRGATSITGENKPLWVVDGIPLEDIVSITNDQLSSGDATTILGSSVAGLNANDIETMYFLKDASATALYGARAMNGVIVITTKKGQAGKTQINYSGNFATMLKPSYDKFNIMNSAQQMGVYTELLDKGWLNFSDVSRSENGGVFAKAADLISTYDPTTGQFGLKNDKESINNFLYRYANANTDWFDVLFRNSFSQEHNLSISYGTDKSQSYFSTNFFNDNGWTIGDKVNRYTVNFRNNYNVNDKLTIGVITTASLRQQKAPGTVDRVSNKVVGGYDRDFDINPFSYALNTSRTITAYDENGGLEYFRKNYAPFNIINELANNTLNVDVMDAKLQGELSYKIVKHLKFDFSGVLRYVQTTLQHEVTENSNMANAYRAASSSTIRENNKFLYRDPENPDAEPQVVLPKGGFYNRTDNRLLNYNVRAVLSYNNTFAKDHSVDLLGGMEVKYADRQNASSTGFGYQYGGGGIPFVDYRIVKQLLENNFNYYGMGTTHDRFVAFFANGAYSYKGKYTINGTVREDGSNNLGKSADSRWLPTWTVAGSWNLGAESFMRNLKPTLSSLIIRGSYGLNADYGVANNSSVILKTKTTNRPYLSESESGIELLSLENSELTWEKKYEGNIGIDAGLFRNRMNITVDAYKRNSFDLISIIKTGGIGGEVSKAANYADMESKGIEATVGGKVISNKTWSWRPNVTFAYNTTKITNIKNLSQIYDLVAPTGGSTIGYPVRALFSIPFVGLDPASGIPLFINQNGSTSADVALQSTSTGNLKYEGPADPTITGGFSNAFTFKDFALNILFTYSTGNKVRLNPVFSANYSDLNAMPKEFINRWVVPGDELVTDIPSISDKRAVYLLGTASPYSFYNFSSARIADGSFVKLKTVSLSYSLPQRFAKVVGLSSSSLSLTGNNLWLIYSDKKLKGQDPEFFNSGGLASPVYTQYVLSLKVGF